MEQYFQFRSQSPRHFRVVGQRGRGREEEGEEAASLVSTSDEEEDEDEDEDREEDEDEDEAEDEDEEDEEDEEREGDVTEEEREGDVVRQRKRPRLPLSQSPTAAQPPPIMSGNGVNLQGRKASFVQGRQFNRRFPVYVPRRPDRVKSTTAQTATVRQPSHEQATTPSAAAASTAQTARMRQPSGRATAHNATTQGRGSSVSRGINKGRHKGDNTGRGTASAGKPKGRGGRGCGIQGEGDVDSDEPRSPHEDWSRAVSGMVQDGRTGQAALRHAGQCVRQAFLPISPHSAHAYKSSIVEAITSGLNYVDRAALDPTAQPRTWRARMQRKLAQTKVHMYYKQLFWQAYKVRWGLKGPIKRRERGGAAAPPPPPREAALREAAPEDERQAEQTGTSAEHAAAAVGAATPIYIYVLQLAHGRRYVGQTKNLDYRISEHYRDGGCEWTKMYRPISILKLREAVGNPYLDEDHETTQQMLECGSIDLVRGGSYCAPDLCQWLYRNIVRQIRHAKKQCLKCGSHLHLVKDCTCKNYRPPPRQPQPQPQQPPPQKPQQPQLPLSRQPSASEMRAQILSLLATPEATPRIEVVDDSAAGVASASSCSSDCGGGGGNQAHQRMCGSSRGVGAHQVASPAGAPDSPVGVAQSTVMIRARIGDDPLLDA